MKAYHKFRLFSPLKQITLIVISLHLLLLFSLSIHHLATRKSPPPKPMAIRTITPAPAKSVTIATPKTTPTPVPIAAAPPKPKAKPVTEVKPKPTAAKKKQETLTATSAPLPTPAPMPKAKPALTIPSKLPPKEEVVPTALELPLAKEEPTYGEYLITFLQSSLALPEYGEVKIDLEIDRFGNLLGCDILEAKSKKNAEAIKNRLPELTFPCLNEFGILDTAHTFTITFRNVENR
jgi:hypothetical protein